MTLKLPYRLAAAAGLWLSSAAIAQQPQMSAAPALQAASPDQKIADAVANRIAGMPSLSGVACVVVCDRGVVELRGTAADAAQHSMALKVARSVANVSMVRDGLTVGSIRQVAGPGEPLGQPAPIAGGGFGVDPMPLNGGGYNMAPPNMPPYAWPTYAPHNNYSRVAYPTDYPHSAFPFIGPMYPFPKVPLGYRAIKLEWEDGHWWYGRNGVNRDWWKVRYW